MFRSSADNNNTINADIGHRSLLKCLLFFGSFHPLWQKEDLSVMDQIKCSSIVLLVSDKVFS